MTYEINKKFWDFFRLNQDKRFVICVGGAGSSKSYSIAQWLIKKLYQDKDKEFLIVRKTFPSLRITALKLILDLLDSYNLPYHFNKAEFRLNVNHNEMIFRGLDDPEKVKSFEPNYIWMEEASEFTDKDFTQLNLRLRRHTDTKNQIYLSFNPIEKSFSWLYKRFFEEENEEAAVLKTTYKDNLRYLSRAYIKELEGLKNQDETTYEIYTLGEWGILRNIIYTNYELVDKWPDSVEETIYGLDFGFNNPSALEEIGIKDQEIYERELLYETHLTNEDLIKRMEELIPKKSSSIYADSAEPARIEEIKRAGFNVYPAEKNVKDGIDFIKRQECHILKSSTNLVKEIRGYKYKENKDGNVLEEPVKFRDHLMDCRRMALYTHLGNRAKKKNVPSTIGVRTGRYPREVHQISKGWRIMEKQRPRFMKPR